MARGITFITTSEKADWDTWREAKTDYIAFIPEGAEFPDGYFERLYQVYSDRPLYRKISIVSPALTVDEYSAKIYGWIVGQSSLIPSRIKSSLEPYGVQVAYLPGSLVKKTALEKLQPKFTGAALQDSINLSIAMWQQGLHCYIEPRVSYEPAGASVLQYPIIYPADDLYDDMDEIRMLFKREMIG